MPALPFAHHLEPVDHATALGPEKQALDAVREQMGFVPNMHAYMANAPAALHTYLLGYNSFRSESGFTPAEQEVVYLAASLHNECDYCVAAHSLVADQRLGVAPEVLAAIRNGTPIPDARLAALYALTVEMMRTRARPDAQTVQRFLAAGYQERDLLYIVLAIAVKTLGNFCNRLLDTPLDAYFSRYRV